MWLCDNQVLTVWVEIEGVLQEVGRARIESSLHTEKSAGECVFVLIWHIRNSINFMDIFSNLLNLRVITVMGAWLYRHFINGIAVVDFLIEFPRYHIHEFLFICYVKLLNVHSKKHLVKFEHFLTAKLEIGNRNEIKQH